MIGNMTSTTEMVAVKCEHRHYQRSTKSAIAQLVGRIARYFLAQTEYSGIELRQGNQVRHFSSRSWSRHSALINEFYHHADKG